MGFDDGSFCATSPGHLGTLTDWRRVWDFAVHPHSLGFCVSRALGAFSAKDRNNVDYVNVGWICGSKVV